MLLPPGLAAAFFVVQYAVFGLCLGGSFAPSHKGMPIVASTATIDFLRRQVLMSRNVRGGIAVDAAMGGLNYQIEHHLFPSMPRPNLKRAQPIVRAYCAANDVSYSEVGLFESYGIVVELPQQRGPAGEGAVRLSRGLDVPRLIASWGRFRWTGLVVSNVLASIAVRTRIGDQGAQAVT